MIAKDVDKSRKKKAVSKPMADIWPRSDANPFLDVFSTNLGWFAILGMDGVLWSVGFGFRTESAAVAAAGRPVPEAVSRITWQPELAERLLDFAAGAVQDFSDVVISMDHLTPFARRVVSACRQVPWGETATYGDLAKRAGSPNAARAVGSVMAKNRCPIIVPCHRIVPSSGNLGGFSAPQGVSIKKRLLVMEGTW
jgi:methylated-DNA-[protein]-cysteine S-methyltransferase